MTKKRFLPIFCRVLFPGRLDAREPTGSESPTLDSGEYQRHQSRQEDDLVSKSDEASSGTKPDENLDKETRSEKTDVSGPILVKDHEDSEKATKSESPESQIHLEKEDTTPRTAVEGVSPSEGEEKKSTSEETKSKSKVKSATAKRKASFDEKRSRSSSSKSDESPKKSGGTQRRKEFGKKRESSTKNVSMKLSTEKTSKVVAEKTSEVQKEDEIAVDGVQTKEATSTVLAKSSSKESPDEKEQAVRRKSVDFSSSKDSALMEDKSLSTDTPTATKRKIYDEEEAAQDSSPAKSDLEDHKDEDEAKKVKKHPMEDALGTGEY